MNIADMRPEPGYNDTPRPGKNPGIEWRPGRTINEFLPSVDRQNGDSND